jgi:hypothetical protein
MKKIGLYIFLLLALLPSILNIFFPVYFYFEGTFLDHKHWFPNFYILTFLFFKLYYPIFYGGLTLYGATYYKVNKGAGFVFLIAQSIILLYVLQYHEWGFSIASKYVYLQIAIPLIIPLPGVAKQLSFRYTANYNYFIFMGYILLSLVLSEFHPFSKYPMYNQFPNYAYLFFIRDNANQFVPLNAHYTATGANLGHLYFSICDLHHFNATNINTRSDTSDIIGKEMLHYIVSTRYNKSIPDSISINRICLHLEGGKIISNEIRLFKDKVE